MFKGIISKIKSKINFNLSLLLSLVPLLVIQVNPFYAVGKVAQNPGDIVRVVLFFSPTCGHCHQVIEEDLPPIIETYGEKLEILMVDISTPGGRQLFQSAADYFKNLREIRGVPTLVIGEQVLVGSIEIPEQFPPLIEAGLRDGGVNWPAIPGLSEIIETQNGEGVQEGTSTPTAPTQATINENVPTAIPFSEVSTSGPIELVSASESSTEVPIFIQRFLQDPVGNSIAVVTLIGMLISIVAVGYYFLRIPGEDFQAQPRVLSWPGWAIPVLCIAGLGVAAYMSYVEITSVEAICGPLGDCNSVQQSPYATLWGFFPVGVLGMIGYLAIGAAWYLHRYGPVNGRGFFAIAMWGMALLGTLFSIYLTFLEPFVIGATCAWCISSAVLITMLLWASTKPAIQSITQDAYEA